jgi:serine/threonine protein kinase
MNTGESSFSGRMLGGKYLLGEKLGQGGYGTVYAATQRDLGRPVAIKVLHGELSYDAVMRFEREARAAAALGHPNIVQVTDFSAQPGEPPYLVMEMLAGETLGSVLRRVGRLPAARVAWIAHQVLAALDAAHRAGIVHRDVKPDNVFLVSSTGVEDFVKLLDFGIAKLDVHGPTQLTATGAMLGSPAYMSPEQVKSLDVDPRTDLYAVGATMYLALAGRLPFDAPSMHALLFAIAESPAMPLATIDASIDPRLVMVVERAMQKDRSMRFQSAAEMRGALDAFVARGMTNAPPPAMTPYPPTPPAAPPPPAASPPTKSNAVLIGIIVALFAVVLLVVAIAGVLLYLRRGDDSPTSASTAVASSSSSSMTPTATPTGSVAATAVATAGGKKPAVVPPGKTDAGASPAAVDAGASAPAAVDAGVAPSKKQMAGTDPRIMGGAFGKYDIEKTKAAVNAVMPAIKACYVATEFEPPDHQFTNWVLTADAAGNVTSARRKTEYDPHPKLDTCLKSAFRLVKLQPMPGGGETEIHLSARTKDNP